MIFAERIIMMELDLLPKRKPLESLITFFKNSESF